MLISAYVDNQMSTNTKLCTITDNNRTTYQDDLADDILYIDIYIYCGGSETMIEMVQEGINSKGPGRDR